MWVIRCVLAKGVEFVLSLPMLVGFVIYYLVVRPGRARLGARALPARRCCCSSSLLVGLGLVLAPITVLATDMQRVVRIVLRFLFYLSPVLYGTHAVPDPLRALLHPQPAQRHPVALPRRPVRARRCRGSTSA